MVNLSCCICLVAQLAPLGLSSNAPLVFSFRALLCLSVCFVLLSGLMTTELSEYIVKRAGLAVSVAERLGAIEKETEWERSGGGGGVGGAGGLVGLPHTHEL
jgi:hypothetical protein